MDRVGEWHHMGLIVHDVSVALKGYYFADSFSPTFSCQQFAIRCLELLKLIYSIVEYLQSPLKHFVLLYQN